MGGQHSQSARLEEEKNYFPPPGIEPCFFRRPVGSLDSIQIDYHVSIEWENKLKR